MTKQQEPSESTRSNSFQRRGRTARRRGLPWLWIGLGLGVLAIAAVLQFRPGNAAPEEISTAQAYEKYQQGVFFLDIRSQAEWNQAHIAHSVLIPLDELQSRLSELPRDKDIVVVCLSGVRSQAAVTILRRAGFYRASWMEGGLEAWQAAGYPLEGIAPQIPS